MKSPSLHPTLTDSQTPRGFCGLLCFLWDILMCSAMWTCHIKALCESRICSWFAGFVCLIGNLLLIWFFTELLHSEVSGGDFPPLPVPWSIWNPVLRSHRICLILAEFCWAEAPENPNCCWIFSWFIPTSPSHLCLAPWHKCWIDVNNTKNPLLSQDLNQPEMSEHQQRQTAAAP